MQNRFLAATLAVVITGTALAGSALAKPTPKSIELSGQIVEVDRIGRTLTVVENVTGRVFSVQVPANSLVGIEPTGSLPSAIPFAHVVRGLKFRAVVRASKIGVTR
jgi:hypothetical protein